LGQLTQLQTLKLTANQLQTLPPELGQLTQLQTLELYNNHLQGLPAALARLPVQCRVNAANNRFSAEAAAAFQDQVTQQRAQNPTLGPQILLSIFDNNPLGAQATLEQAIEFWKVQCQSNFASSNPIYAQLPQEMFASGNPAEQPFYAPLSQLSPDQRNHLTHFLVRLRATEDFKHPTTSQGVILNAMRILQGACTSASFREVLFPILDDTLRTCGDGIAETLDSISLQWQIYCGAENKNEEEIAHLLIGANRIDKLNFIAEEHIRNKGLGDPVEILLYFKTQLKRDLHLPITTEGMLYPGMARAISNQDLTDAKERVLAQTSSLDQIVEILTFSSLWQESIKKQYPKEIAAIVERISEEITALVFPEEGAPLPMSLDGSRELNEREKQDRINQLYTQKKETIIGFIRNYTEKFVRGRLIGGSSSSSSNNR
jgi:hypothetical protein